MREHTHNTHARARLMFSAMGVLCGRALDWALGWHFDRTNHECAPLGGVAGAIGARVCVCLYVFSSMYSALYYFFWFSISCSTYRTFIHGSYAKQSCTLAFSLDRACVCESRSIPKYIAPPYTTHLNRVRGFIVRRPNKTNGKPDHHARRSRCALRERARSYCSIPTVCVRVRPRARALVRACSRPARELSSRFPNRTRS